MNLIVTRCYFIIHREVKVELYIKFALKNYLTFRGLKLQKLLNISQRILDKLKIFKLYFSYDYQEILVKQNSLYHQIGLNREKALETLADIYLNHPELEVLKSEHHTLFAAMSSHQKIKSILEIGTYTASFTKLLSILYPDAEITTMDLPDDDPTFKQTYDRNISNERLRFISERNSLIKSCANVNFVQENSLLLINNRDLKFDLIWVDGAHGYPMIAMDIVNSLSCLTKKGLMFIDDVWIDRSQNDSNYRSIGAFESILALKNAGLIDYALIPKRIEFPHGEGHLKKYIARVFRSEDFKE